MKNIRNTGFLFAFLLGGAMLLTACREDEKLGLAGYPAAGVGISIVGEENAASTVTLKATYDHAGKIGIDGPITRQYVLALSTASPEEVVLHVEPLIVNIPADKIQIDKTELRIPAGEKQAEPVTVTFADEDFSFAEPDLEARSYEAGIKIARADGYNLNLPDNGEAKVVIDKAAYVAGGSIESEGGNTISFKRDYCDGKIVTEEPMAHSFKIALERPAKADVKVTFTTAGLAEQFAADMTLAPAEVTIPAGATESEEVNWALKDDFLLTTAEKESHVVTLTATFECTDPTVKVLEGRNILTFNIDKIPNILKLVDKVADDWTMFDRAGWTATGEGGYGTPSNVLDNDAWSDYYGSGMTLELAVDMKEEKTAVGMVVRYYSNYASKVARISSSADGETWEELGTLNDLPEQKFHCFQFIVPAKARYLKFSSLECLNVYHDITEIEVYGAK